MPEHGDESMAEYFERRDMFDDEDDEIDEAPGMAAEADAAGEQTRRIAARRQLIRDMAKCRQCGGDAKSCNDGIKARGGPEGICCYGGIPGHGHVEDVRLLDELLREVADGYVRSIDEAYPPPVQGPHPAPMTWLLDQATWWAPYRRPMIRVDQMDKPHRLNVLRWLERRASSLEERDRWRGIWADAPDDVWADLMHRTPEEFIRETPLHRRLRKGLPTGGKKLRLLEARAVHWNTCPMRRAHPGPAERCACVRAGGKVVGATNDPATVTA